MKKRKKVIIIDIPEKLSGSYQRFPLLSADICLELRGAVGLKDIKFKEIIVIYEKKVTEFKGF
jgi:hypothetical protein